MNLSTKQKQHLKGLAHPLKPVVMLGNNGLTEGVLAEIDQALTHHELIKVKIATEDRETKNRWWKPLFAKREPVTCRLSARRWCCTARQKNVKSPAALIAFADDSAGRNCHAPALDKGRDAAFSFLYNHATL